MDDVLKEEQCVQIDGGPLRVLSCLVPPVHVCCKVLKGRRMRNGREWRGKGEEGYGRTGQVVGWEREERNVEQDKARTVRSK